MVVDRGHQALSRCLHGDIPVTGQPVRQVPAIEHSSVSGVWNVEPGRMCLFEDRPQQLDHIGAAGDGVGHREIPQEGKCLGSRVEDSLAAVVGRLWDDPWASSL
ncbi:hypothetical protein ACGFMM_18950 [Streptomyces sp. NPDC048604]|uniref:hypothetical protein n=1 Tax=Streptomyces sp. NPDC048604 TaxID=3365578 RepID=UPI0037137337